MGVYTVFLSKETYLYIHICLCIAFVPESVKSQLLEEQYIVYVLGIFVSQENLELKIDGKIILSKLLTSLDFLP